MCYRCVGLWFRIFLRSKMTKQHTYRVSSLYLATIPTKLLTTNPLTKRPRSKRPQTLSRGLVAHWAVCRPRTDVSWCLINKRACWVHIATDRRSSTHPLFTVLVNFPRLLCAKLKLSPLDQSMTWTGSALYYIVETRNGVLELCTVQNNMCVLICDCGPYDPWL